MPTVHVKITVRSYSKEDNQQAFARGQLHFAEMPKKGDEVSIGSNVLVVVGIEWASNGGPYLPIIHLEGLCFPYRGPADTATAVANCIEKHLLPF